MTARIPLPDGLDPRAFSYRDGLDAGLGRSRLSGPDLHAPLWGVRTRSADLSLEELGAAYLHRAHPSAFFSHATAAHLLGIRLPGRLPPLPTIDVAVPYPKRAPAAASIRAHKLTIAPDELTNVMGLPCTSAARTVCDLAQWLSAEELLAAADSALWRRRPLSTADELAAEFDRYAWRGKGRIAQIRTEVSDRSDSAPESMIRWRLYRAGLPRVTVNPMLYDSRGRFLAMPDLAFVEYRMALDYEGDHHRVDRAQWQKDISRVPRLQDAGWHHTRMSAADLRSSDALLARLARLLTEKGWNPS